MFPTRFVLARFRYVGQWKQDKRDGEGCETLADGSQYKGQFVNGLKSGHGVMTASNGDVYDGNFEQGEMSGEENTPVAVARTVSYSFSIFFLVLASAVAGVNSDEALVFYCFCHGSCHRCVELR